MVQKSEKVEKFQKISKNHIFPPPKNINNKRRKKPAEKNAILLVLKYQEDAIQPELSRPARFRFQGGQYKPDGQTNGRNSCV